MKFLATTIWLVVAGIAGYAMFGINFRVEALQAEVSALHRAEAREREAIHILEAEWSYLSRPGRIQTLTSEFRPEMAPAAAAQIITLDRIPAPLPEAPGPAEPPSLAPSVRAPGPMARTARSGAVLMPVAASAPGRMQP